MGIEGRTQEGIKGTTGSTYKMIEYNLAIANDVIEVLKSINLDKFIVLENFHYLSDETQHSLSFDLRNFQDANINFIILGIWRERNRLSQYNGDLLDRSVEIPVEPWRREDFLNVIAKGSRLLNADMREVESDLIDAAFDSIGVLQELCKECCLAAKVDYQGDKVAITKEHLKTAVLKKYDDYAGRHVKSFESFGAGLKESVGDSTGYYFLHAVLALRNSILEGGLSKVQLENKIKLAFEGQEHLEAKLNNVLKKITEYQLDCRITPPLFAYDLSLNKLVITDSTLYFFLKHCNEEEIRKLIQPSPL